MEKWINWAYFLSYSFLQITYNILVSYEESFLVLK